MIDVLLGEGQLADFFTTATSVEEFDRLTNFQLHRYLARTWSADDRRQPVDPRVSVMLSR